MPANGQRAIFQSSSVDGVKERAISRANEVSLASADLSQGKSGSRRIVLSLLEESSTPLTSTSVSVSRGSLTRPAATSQGWPQQLQQQPSVEQDGVQTQPRSSLPRQQPSLGEGIPIDASAASDLYMARRRISPRLHKYTDANTSGSGNACIPGTDELYISQSSTTSVPTAESVSRGVTAMRTSKRALLGQDKSNTDVRSSRSTPTPQPNGGAYLQAGEEKEGPVHTRPRNPTASGFSGDTDQHHGAGSTNFTTTSHAASSLAQAVASGLQAHEARLSCHNRYRDHHGRNSALSWIATLGAFFLLTMAMVMVGIAPSVAVLALVYPLSAKEEQEVTTSRSQTFVRCSTKNSSWLSTYASMQLASSKSSSRGRGNEKDGGVGKAQQHSAWLRGLMYPSANAVLQSVPGA